MPVNNPQYKVYSNQIANIFCAETVNQNICKASVTTRLNTYLDDYTFPIFLDKLSVGGRFYISVCEAFQNRGFRFVIVDLITGVRETAWWNVPYNYPYLGKLPGVLNQHKFEIISANRTYNEQNKSDFRITWNGTKDAYGITFVPPTPGGGTTGGNGTPSPGGGGTPGGGGIVVTPPQQQPLPTVPEAQTLNIKSLFDNPLILIGGGVALYLLLMKK